MKKISRLAGARHPDNTPRSHLSRRLIALFFFKQIVGSLARAWELSIPTQFPRPPPGTRCCFRLRPPPPGDPPLPTRHHHQASLPRAPPGSPHPCSHAVMAGSISARRREYHSGQPRPPPGAITAGTPRSPARRRDPCTPLLHTTASSQAMATSLDDGTVPDELIGARTLRVTT